MWWKCLLIIEKALLTRINFGTDKLEIEYQFLEDAFFLSPQNEVAQMSSSHATFLSLTFLSYDLWAVLAMICEPSFQVKS